MERATGTAIPAGHVCLMHGSPRGRWFALTGAAMFVASIAVTTTLAHAGEAFHRYAGGGVATAAIGLTLFALGLHDVLGQRAFRRIAGTSRDPAWTHVRGAPTSGEIRVTALRPANQAWRWVVRLTLVTAVVAYLMLPLAAIGGGGIRAIGWTAVSIGACVVLLVGLEFFRGKARGRVEFPTPCLLAGETAEVLFQIDRCGAELPPESAEFTLRRVEARPAFGGLLRTTIVADSVAPSAIRFVPGEHDAWEISFRLRDDLAGADLLGTPPTYWEFVVDMAGRRQAYHQAFVAPVFTREQARIPAGTPAPRREGLGPPRLGPSRAHSALRRDLAPGADDGAR